MSNSMIVDEALNAALEEFHLRMQEEAAGAKGSGLRRDDRMDRCVKAAIKTYLAAMPEQVEVSDDVAVPLLAVSIAEFSGRYWVNMAPKVRTEWERRARNGLATLRAVGIKLVKEA